MIAQSMLHVSVQALQAFGKGSSIPGVSKIVDNETSKTRRVIWIVVVSVGALCFVGHFVLLLLRFLDQPVNNEIHMDSVPFLFPDVTLCHTGPYSFIRSKGQDGLLIDPATGRTGSSNDIVMGIKNFWKAVEPEFRHLDFNVYTRVDNVAAKHSLYSWGLGHEFGHYAHELILACEYQRKPCSFLNFSTVIVPGFLNCFTFAPSQRLVRMSGESEGLLLAFMDADRRNIMSDVETMDFIRGINVIIHPPHTLPDFGVFDVAQVGLFSKIGVELVEYQRLNRNASPCQEAPQDTTVSPMNQRRQVVVNQTFSHSAAACTWAAAQETFVSQCRCYSEMFDIPRNLAQLALFYCHAVPASAVFPEYYRGKNASILVSTAGRNVSLELLVSNATVEEVLSRKRCHENLLERMNFAELQDMHCTAPCKFSSYRISVSKFNWPSAMRYVTKPLIDAAINVKALRNDLNRSAGLLARRILNQTQSNKGNKLRTEEDIAKNFGRLLIYPKVSRGTLVLESEAYPTSTFLSDIGGILGLWIGFSVITLVELVEAALSCCCRYDVSPPPSQSQRPFL